MNALFFSTTLGLLARSVVADDGGDEAQAAQDMADANNIWCEKLLAWTWAALVGSVLAYRVIILGIQYIRNIACLGHDNQQYFLSPEGTLATAKRYILLAPLFRRRHHREFRLSTAINMGTLPSRLQTLFLVGYLALNITLSTILTPWNQPSEVWVGILMDRTGVLAVTNLLPLFLLAGRNNPLIKLLGISFDTYNLIHRWIGRLVVLEALVHALCWFIPEVQETGWKSVNIAEEKSLMILTGTIGICAFIAILIQSPSVVRHAYYEVFLHVHFLLALTVVIVIYMHLDGYSQQQFLLMSATGIWLGERVMRVVSIVRNNAGAGGTKVVVEALPGDAIRVTIRVARPWKFKPGQHIYLYLPSVGWWTSHPFSLAWSDEAQDVYSEKGLPTDQRDVLSMKKTTMSLIIRRRTGFTDKLWQKAEKSETGRFVSTAIIEGPYGSQTLSSYGTVMLFAAGVGITHQVPHVRALVAGFANNTCATRRVCLVWIIQSPEHLEWIRPWMTSILGMERRREILQIKLFVTRPRSTKEIHSPSSSVQMYPGKPDIDALVAQEQAQQVGAMAVSVCGTGGLADDVRKVVRGRCDETNMDFVENAFSW